MTRVVAVMAGLLVLAGCAGEDRLDRLQPGGFLAEAPQMVAAADWSAPDTVSMTLSDYAFTPNHITVHRNRPTRLVLRNVADGDHTFVSDGFFKTIAVKQVSGPAGLAAGPWVEKVVVPAGQTKELWFIPATYGSWGFQCSQPGHAMLGMTGVVDVVP
jgi:uncharacterized cupredoxin-like copper-binding protein